MKSHAVVKSIKTHTTNLVTNPIKYQPNITILNISSSQINQSK
jgi:hypothetical protein